MSFKTWADSKVKRFSWIDLKLVQISAIGCFLMIAKLWKPLLRLDWYWYAVIAVLAGIKPVYNALRK
ncbi:hypothetical protein KAX35_08295 [candidate division WOR-3 bacterium]|nr:hypothetical protein [candidate division WOR-3 bacterium]